MNTAIGINRLALKSVKGSSLIKQACRSPTMISLRNRSNIRQFSNSTKTFNIASQASTPTSKEAAKKHLQDLKSFKWDEFLSLRKQERRLNMYVSIGTAGLGALAGWGYISQVELDSSLTLFGFDPLLVASVTLLATGSLGYLAGPVLGSAIFKAKNKSILQLYQEKNSIFLKHIIKNRVDASRQSFSNPVPDFYGEKITSLKQYRQWLRDCNAYRRKSSDFL